MTDNLATTNLWLGIIGVISITEFLVMVVMAVVGYRMYRQMTSTLERVEDTYVAPLHARMTRFTGEAEDAFGRMRQLEDRVSGMVARIEETASRVTSIAQHAWPVLGTWRAVAAAVGSFRGRREEPGRQLVNRRRYAPPAAMEDIGTGPWPLPESASRRPVAGRR